MTGRPRPNSATRATILDHNEELLEARRLWALPLYSKGSIIYEVPGWLVNTNLMCNSKEAEGLAHRAYLGSK